MNITLQLWVSNQDEAGGDYTADYIRESQWAAPPGIQLDLDAQTLSGEAEAAWAAYQSLRQAVSEGDDLSPCLTACPEQLICSRYTSAAESLARLESPVQKTWADFVRSVPSSLAGPRQAKIEEIISEAWEIDTCASAMAESWHEDMPPEVLADLLEECGVSHLAAKLREMMRLA